MSLAGSALQRLQQRATQADQTIAALKTQLHLLRTNAVANACHVEAEKLRQENAKLQEEVEQLKQHLVIAEIRNGVKQVPMPGKAKASTAEPASSVPAAAPAPAALPEAKPQEKKGKEKKPANAKPKKEQQKPAGGAADGPVDVSRLDMRIGHIVKAEKHPDADSLYVEQVDLGEGKTRTIVSGLVKHIPIEQMQNRLAIFTCNLKPAKMRGVLSEGMIMCASSPEKVEIINPPPGVVIGDRIMVEGFPGTPDAQLNPKKKIWESVQPDLRINAEGVATYKGAPWKIVDKEGKCVAPSMKDSAIK